MRGLKIYEIDSNYVKYLSNIQEHLFASDGNKASRKYIGIILDINGFKYFAPLSSFKPKHSKMSNRILKNADIVYKHKVRNVEATALAKRTNDFQKLEQACKEY